MKLFKRISAILSLLTLMLTALPLTTIAANDPLIDPKGEVSLTIYKYKADSEVEYPNTSTGLEQQIPTDAVTIQGVEFKIELVELIGGRQEGSTNPDDYEYSNFSTIGTTDENGKIVFSTENSLVQRSANTAPLPKQGIYKVTEIIGPDTTNAPFLVRLPMTDPVNLDNWIYDVVVYPKNDVKLAIDKEYVGNPSDGNVLSWKIAVSVPNDIIIKQIPLIDIDNTNVGNAKLVITDALDYRLKYVDGTIIGTYTNSMGSQNLELSTNNGATGDYILTIEDDLINSRVMTITLTEAGLKKLANASDGPGQAVNISFTFDTRDDMGDDTNLGIISNGATVEYTNSSGYEYVELTDEDETTLYGIEIDKVNLENDPLAGAKFKIYTDPECTKALLNWEGSEEWSTTTAVGSGKAYIYGLVEGTYYLVETEAPNGYNLRGEPVTVVIDPNHPENIGIVNHMVTMTITNSKGFTLPITGGVGTILFTLGGLLFIGLAVVFLTLSRKKNTNKQTKA